MLLLVHYYRRDSDAKNEYVNSGVVPKLLLDEGMSKLDFGLEVMKSILQEYELYSFRGGE